MNMDRGSWFSFMKYSLIIINVFGFILAIFNALFGIGYKEKIWPGGYTGGQMAIFSLFVMVFTTVGYCGAHHHKAYLLVIYGFILFIFTVGNVVIWVVYNDKSMLGSMQHGYIVFFSTIDFFLMLFAFFMAFKMRQNQPQQSLSSQQQTFSQGNSILIRGSSDSDHHQTREHHNRSPHYQTTNIQTAHPCPVPGCTYGKVIS